MSIASPETITDNEVFEDMMEKLDTPWVIKILDDSVSTMDHVVAVFIKHFKLDENVAIAKMLEVHNSGSATLDSGTEDEMLVHHEAMRGYKLLSSVEKAS